MNQVSDGKVIIEDGNVVGDTNDESEVWVHEFTDKNKPDELLDENWAQEFRERVVENSMLIIFVFILCQSSFQ